MKRTFLLLALLTPMLAAADPAGKTSPNEVQFEAANRLYEEGKFPEAATGYETILKGGSASPALWFNLGNAYFKSGEIGRAIVAYNHIAQLTPRDPDVRANLQFARNQVEGPTLRPTRWERLFATLSLNEWATFTVVGLWITFILLAAMQIRPSLKPSLRTLAAAAGGATLVLAACLFLAVSTGSAAKTVVVTAKDVVVHNGPLGESPAAFTAHDGAEFRVLDRFKDDWLQVSDGSRYVGWLKRSEVSAL